MGETSETLKKLVNSSGFPLQLRVEREIATLSSRQGWQVVASEHHWRDKDSGNEGYIDILLQNAHGVIRLAVECKRVLDSSWVFLTEDNSSDRVNRARLLWTSQKPDCRDMMGWGEFVIQPPSFQSAFCVVRGQTAKDKPMLERLCGMVLQSLEALAEEGLTLQAFRDDETVGVYVPVIVTTAQLEICLYDPDDIDIATGELSDAEFKPVPFVRFRKAMATRIFGEQPWSDFDQVSRERERTVFVVQANEIAGFLKDWDMLLTHLGWPWKNARAKSSS